MESTEAAPQKIPMQRVESSQIDAIGYDPETKTLAVTFSNMATYHYFDVPPEAHAALIGAESIGSHFYRHFKKAGYRFQRQPA